jgi:hypothetical protein
MLRYNLSLLALAALTFGQTTPTHVGQHQMGETRQEWLAVSHELEKLDTVCQSKKRGVDKSNCELLQNIRDGKQNEIVTTINNRSYTWKFADGKLSEVHIAPNLFGTEQDRLLYFQEETGFLSQTYGKPSNVRTVPYHNTYGAQWERSNIDWNMPDGTQITAVEDPSFAGQGKLSLILFLSKDALAGPTQQTKPNPYKQ